MLVSVPGGNFLTSLLNVITQSLLIPVIVLLLIFAFFVVISLGSLISEYTSRREVSVKEIDTLVENIDKSTSLEEVKNLIYSSNINKSQKKVLKKILESDDLSNDARETIADKLVERREELIHKNLAHKIINFKDLSFTN